MSADDDRLFYWHPLAGSATCWTFSSGLSQRSPPHDVLIHGATTLLVLRHSRHDRSAVAERAVAALFAVHPLHAEPVAWIAERKELLAGFFWFASLVAYAWYARRPSWNRYLLIAICFVLGLMSKPVIVTLPLVLLLLDFWPLRRRRLLVIEKLPLLLLSVVSSVVTFVGQDRTGAMRSLADVAVADRVRNAVTSYGIYPAELAWPRALAPLYPYDRTSAAAMFPMAATTLLIITAIAILLRKRVPFLLFGWLWFIGVLVPMIGLVQVGGQSHADRFMYLPAVGVFVIVVWGTARWLEGRAHGVIAVVLAAVVIGALGTRVGADATGRIASRCSAPSRRRRTMPSPCTCSALVSPLKAASRKRFLFTGVASRNRERYPYNLGSLLRRQKPTSCGGLRAARLHPHSPMHYSLGATLLQLAAGGPKGVSQKRR